MAWTAAVDGVVAAAVGVRVGTAVFFQNREKGVFTALVMVGRGVTDTFGLRGALLEAKSITITAKRTSDMDMNNLTMTATVNDMF